MNKKFLIGIDEVGRGPLAGPVAVGVVMATTEAVNAFREIKESKQLSEKKREIWNETRGVSKKNKKTLSHLFVSLSPQQGSPTCPQ